MGATSTEQPAVRLPEREYADPRPAGYFDRFYTWADRHEPDWVYSAVRVGALLLLRPFYRVRGINADHVPPSGPVIVAPNHFSHLDHLILGAPLRRKLRFMAKSQLFSPVLQEIILHCGAYPVRRGTGDGRALATTLGILERGGAMAMYCEGGRSRTTGLAERPKWGIGHVALTSGAPVVPTAIFGSQHAHDWKRGQFPPVTVKYGTPLRFERLEAPTKAQSQAVADVIFEEIRSLYEGLQTRGRTAELRDGR